MKTVKHKLGWLLGVIAVMSFIQLMTAAFSVQSLFIVGSTWILIAVVLIIVRHVHKQRV